MKQVIETYVLKFDSPITAIEFETGCKYIKREPGFETGSLAQFPIDSFGVDGSFEYIDRLVDSSTIDADQDLNSVLMDTHDLEQKRLEEELIENKKEQIKLERIFTED